MDGSTTPAADGRDLDELRTVSARRGYDRMSDTRLTQQISQILRTPRAGPATSFVLHAPLELAARSALLALVEPASRELARLRLASLGVEYEAAGEAVTPPIERDHPSLRAAARALVAAIDAGDLDDVDGISAWLGRHAAPSDLARLLADDVVPRLSAAAHGPIVLYQLPRVAPRTEITPEVLRPLAREMAREPKWKLEWMDQPGRTPPTRHRDASGTALLDALASTPQLGLPGSDFIHPVMAQVERSGTAAQLLDGAPLDVDVDVAARTILRVAAWTMLNEPPTYAPYGWTHCLTMPQATLSLASRCRRPRTAVAVAATYVVGFRAAMATEALTMDLDESDPGIPVDAALRDAPDRAAAAAWHAPRSAIDATVAALATRAALHHDAHLAKYTLACFDAAGWDRANLRLYLAAATSLHAWWVQHGGERDALDPR
jgi:hypothetical protein